MRKALVAGGEAARRRLERLADRARAPARPAGARDAPLPRGRDRGAHDPGHGENRAGALEGLRQGGAARRHLHAAAFLRHGQGVPRHGHVDRAVHHLLRPARPRDLSHGGKAPWNLPERWEQKKDALDLATPLDFASTADIIGGNSGSPVVDRAGEFVGIIFDGNIESLAWDYYFDDERGRAVAVDARGILEALNKVYGATALVEELTRR